MSDNQNDPFENKRQHPRVSLDTPADILYQDRHFTFKIINLSLGGLGLLGPETIPVGAPIQTIFKLPFHNSPSQLTLNAHVMHTTEFHNQHSVIHHQYIVGVQFESLSAHQKTVIEHYVNQRLLNQAW
jgi:c-di-GMP-binding flagellar brake protein YcgR